jgi:MerT mercuric transport protein
MERSSHPLSRWAALGAAVSALFGSCCALPLLLLTLTGTVGFAGSLVSYQKYFTAAAIAFLILAFYFFYGKKGKQGEGFQSCSLRQRKTTQILLWVSALLVLIFLVGPHLLPR